MTVEIHKTFRFESAHWIPGFADGHKCRRLHGHSFVLEVWCKGPVDAQTGVVMDFADIKAVVAPIVDRVDHYCLNDLGTAWNDPLLLNPTSENLAIWFYRQIKPLLPLLDHVRVHETCTSSCRYRGE